MDRWIDWIDQIDGQIRQMDRWIDGQIDRLDRLDRQMDSKMSSA